MVTIKTLTPPVWSTLVMILKCGGEYLAEHGLVEFEFEARYLVKYVHGRDVFTQFVQELHDEDGGVSVLVEFE